MAKRKKIFLVALLLFCIGSFTAGILLLQPFGRNTANNSSGLVLDDKQTDAILFWEDFQDGDFAGWEMSDAFELIEEDSCYRLACRGEGYAWLPGSMAWDTNYVCRVTYTLRQGAAVFSFDMTEAGRYMLVIGSDCALFVKENPPGNFTILKNVPAPSVGDVHLMAMGRMGEHLQVYFDKMLYIDAYDKQPLPHGAVLISSGPESAFNIHGMLANEIVNAIPNAQPVVDNLPIEHPFDLEALGAVFPLSALPDAGTAAPAFAANNLPEELILRPGGQTHSSFVKGVLPYLLFGIALVLGILFMLVARRGRAGSKPTGAIDLSAFSSREREVLELMMLGYSMPEIAEKLFISVSTAKGHGDKIYKKLHIHTRQELLLKYRVSE